MDKNTEIALIENTLKLLRRGEYKLSGDEAVVFYNCFQYLVKRLNDLKKPELSVAAPKEPLPKTKKAKDGDK